MPVTLSIGYPTSQTIVSTPDSLDTFKRYEDRRAHEAQHAYAQKKMKTLVSKLLMLMSS